MIANSMIFNRIGQHKSAIKEISDFIYHTPETAFTEHQAAAAQIKFLRANGFEVENPYGGLDTAYHAVYGDGSPHIAILAEYDALPEIGHACGHNLICAAALAAGTAVKDLMQENGCNGTLHLIGTPGEEGSGGKAIMLNHGAFAYIDCALICHPYSATLPDQGALAVSRFDVEFHGTPSHAATAPHEGKNALDAMTLFFNGVNAWRQQLPPLCKIHGIINNGGNVPNIIPDYTSAVFYIRAATVKVQEEMEQRFIRIAQGAALMTDTRAATSKQENSYLPILLNAPLNNFFADHARDFGLEISPCNPQGMISTDFGNVSCRVPGCNWFVQITDDGAVLHTEPFKTAAGSIHAFEQSMKMAAAMAHAALKAMTETEFLDAIKQDFATRQELKVL